MQSDILGVYHYREGRREGLTLLCSKIVVAYDESELARKSLEKAIELAKLDPAIEVQVLHAVTLPIKPNIYGNAFQEVEESMRNYGNEV